jgi:hypothetical protein
MAYIPAHTLSSEPSNPLSSNPKKIYHDFTMEDAEVIGGLCRLQDCVRPTSPRSQMEREKRIRREIANSNERRRMQSINTGFQALKSLIPHTDGEKLSKAAILQQTSEYILQLEKEKAKLHHQNALLIRKLNGGAQPQPQQVAWESDGSDRGSSPPPKWRKVAAETNEVQDSSDEGVGGLTPEANNQRVPSTSGNNDLLQQQTVQMDGMKRNINELTKLLDCERTTSKTLRQLLEERTRDSSFKGVTIDNIHSVTNNNNNNVAICSVASSVALSTPTIAPITISAERSTSKFTAFNVSTPRPIKPQIVTIPQKPSQMVAPIAPAPKIQHRVNAVRPASNPAPLAVALKHPIELGGKNILMTSPPPPAPPVSGTLPLALGLSSQQAMQRQLATSSLVPLQPSPVQQPQFVNAQSAQSQPATHMIIPISIANMATAHLQQISPGQTSSGLSPGNTTVYLTNQFPQMTAASTSGLKVEVKQEPASLQGATVIASPDAAAAALLRHQLQQQQMTSVSSSTLLSPSNSTASLSQQVDPTIRQTPNG